MQELNVGRRQVLALIGTSACQPLFAAGGFPSRPIELVVPFPAGGTTDLMGRALARAMAKHLPNNQSVVVVNVSGASGIVGITSVYNAKPDGYRIGLAGYTTFSLHPHYGRTAFTHDGLQHLGRVANFSQVMLLRKDAPWETFEDWIAYVKQNPEKFTYGVPGVGSILHITMELINQKAGLKTKAVAFNGGAEQMAALLGGHVQGAISGVGDAKTYLDSGDLRILFNAGTGRDSYTEKVPTLKEKGVDVAGDIAFSAVAPKGIPPDALPVLQEVVRKALEDPQLIEQFQKVGLKPEYATPQNVEQEIEAQFKANREVLLKLGLIK